MSGPDASSPEMPGFPFLRRPAMPLDESVLDALMTGTSLPPDAPLLAHTVADMLASLADPVTPGALAGEAAARAAFARAASPAGISPAARRRARRRPKRLGAIVATRLAAVAAAVAVGLGGAVAAAYAGVLPGPIQDFAHAAIGAPAYHKAAPYLPPAVRQEMSRLCDSYQLAAVHGASAVVTGEFAKLARAAGGTGKIDTYCAAVRQTGTGQAPAQHAKPSAYGTTKAPASARAHGAARAHGGAQANTRPTPHPRATPDPKARPEPTATPDPKSTPDPQSTPHPKPTNPAGPTK